MVLHDIDTAQPQLALDVQWSEDAEQAEKDLSMRQQVRGHDTAGCRPSDGTWQPS